MRGFGESGFAFADASLLCSDGELPPADGALQDQPEFSGVPALLVARLPSYAQCSALKEERFRLGIAVAGPGAETVPGDLGLRRSFIGLMTTVERDDTKCQRENSRALRRPHR